MVRVHPSEQSPGEAGWLRTRRWKRRTPWWVSWVRIPPSPRLCSSAARAPVLHTGCPGFESRRGHDPAHAGHTGLARGRPASGGCSSSGRAPDCGSGGGTVRVRPVTLMRARRRRRVGPGCKPGALLRGFESLRPHSCPRSSADESTRFRTWGPLVRFQPGARTKLGLVAFPAERPACKAGIHFRFDSGRGLDACHPL
jgi:hypothetical protein